VTGDRPPSELVIHGVAANGNTKEFFTVDNGCYHMWHRSSISQRIESMLGSLPAPTLVSPMAEG
jgi:hypothetical protein